jgi:hypothetical protein
MPQNDSHVAAHNFGMSAMPATNAIANRMINVHLVKSRFMVSVLNSPQPTV